MALPYATSQLVRYLTDKMLDNVTKQLQQRSGTATDETPPRLGPPELIEIVGHINAAVVKLDADFQAMSQQVAALDKRVKRMEGRWGTWALVRVVLFVALAFALGFVLAWLLKLGGWI